MGRWGLAYFLRRQDFEIRIQSLRSTFIVVNGDAG